MHLNGYFHLLINTFTRYRVKQVEEHQARMQEHMHESNKPLARFADDKDLDEMLRHQSRDGDPMLEYLRNKEQAKDAGKPCKDF